mmetsp:Transcript_23002/g.37841  ORF Transcript_23002/g.37841 Transcript_23002/m.37841 type:complete len:88 (+) Transcript_23002:49-312(+)
MEKYAKALPSPESPLFPPPPSQLQCMYAFHTHQIVWEDGQRKKWDTHKKPKLTVRSALLHPPSLPFPSAPSPHLFLSSPIALINTVL